MAVETASPSAATTTAMGAWTQQYAQVVAGAADSATATPTSGAALSVRQFLENVLAAPSSEPQVSMAGIGEQLRLPLADLSTAKLQKERGLDRDGVLRVLQLQVICRLCSCCRQSATKSKKQRVKPAKQSKQALKATKKEVRSLLDRIALLLDAANPPSLTDGDERSPFHEFLQDVLARAFTTHLPKFVSFLLRVYELADESQELEKLSLSALPPAVASVVKPVDAQATAPADPVAVAGQSILSALKDEQRPLKRSRTETAVPFKKMELPHELRRRSSFPSTRRDLVKAALATATAAAAPPAVPARLPRRTSSSSSRHSTSAGAAPPLARSSTTSSSTTNKPGSKPRRCVSSGTKAAPPLQLSTSADKPRLAHHSSLGARLRPPAPLLVRDTDRGLVAGPQSRFTPSATNRMPHTLVRATSATAPRPLLTGLTRSTSLSGPKPPVAVPPRTAVSSLLAREPSATSVVMRTPDRPQRRAHRAARVLIESSPPFRNPNASARPRKSPSAIPPPLLR